jgi:hypothetical protein
MTAILRNDGKNGALGQEFRFMVCGERQCLIEAVADSR